MTRLIIVWLGRNSGPRNSFYCLGHFKNVYDDDDDKQLWYGTQRGDEN